MLTQTWLLLSNLKCDMTVCLAFAKNNGCQECLKDKGILADRD